MAIPPYTAGQPENGASLGSSKVPIRQNIDGQYQVFAIDHKTQNETNPGYHKDIHVVPRVGDPAPIAGIDQIYSKVVNFGGLGNATQRFHMNDLGGISQLTGTNLNTTGYQFIGAVILMWGTAPASLAGTVTFPLIYGPGVGFSTACLNVNATAYQATFTPGSGSANVVVTDVSITGFNYYMSTVTNYTGIYWTAIGY